MHNCVTFQALSTLDRRTYRKNVPYILASINLTRIKYKTKQIQLLNIRSVVAWLENVITK